jgi:hypothetical protein
MPLLTCNTRGNPAARLLVDAFLDGGDW